MTKVRVLKFNHKFLTCILILSFLFSPVLAFGSEQIYITLSDDMDKIIFDGKWTHQTEWKKSSLDSFSFNNSSTFHFRSAHQDEFIYFMIDFVTDINIDAGSDKAMICLDSLNDKSPIMNSDDYCFLTILETNSSKIFQGTNIEGNELNEIEPPKDFIAISSRSDNNNRYSPTPHSNYEFKIPTNIVGRNNVYGLYIEVYDGKSNSTYTWPRGIVNDSKLEVPGPRQWGELISPDKSLPEFDLPILVLVPLIVVAIYFVKKFKNKNEF